MTQDEPWDELSYTYQPQSDVNKYRRQLFAICLNGFRMGFDSMDWVGGGEVKVRLHMSKMIAIIKLNSGTYTWVIMVWYDMQQDLQECGEF